MPKRRSSGEGTIYKRKDGSWSAQITLPDGKRKTKYGKTQGAMRDWLATQQTQVRAGTWTATDNTRLGEFMERWLDEVAAKQVRPSTLHSYRGAARHATATLGEVKLGALKPEHLQKLYNQKIDDGLSAGTVQIIHGVLHQALKQAAEWGVVARNVAALAHPPRGRHPEPILLTEAQLRDLLRICRKRWLYPLVYLAAATGLRRGELLALAWADVDWEKKTLHVARIVAYEGGRVVVAEPKTMRSRRAVTLPDEALAVLKEWKEQGEGGEWVFPSHNGTVRAPWGLNAAWRTLLRQGGLGHVRFHSLRHLHATWLLEAGVSPKVVSERLGHTNISITLDLYSHVTASLQQQAAETIGKVMGNLKEG